MEDKKEYIIVEESWEYNDESYYRAEAEGYTLVEPKLYTKDEAEKICSEKNANSFDEHIFVNDENDPIQPFKIIKLEL